MEPRIKRPYHLRTKQEQFDTLVKRITRLEAAHEVRYQKIADLHYKANTLMIYIERDNALAKKVAEAKAIYDKQQEEPHANA